MKFEGGEIVLKFHFKIPFLQLCFLNVALSSGGAKHITSLSQGFPAKKMAFDNFDSLVLPRPAPPPPSPSRGVGMISGSLLLLGLGFHFDFVFDLIFSKFRLSIYIYIFIRHIMEKI